jgi:hypothetical protein
MGVIRRGMIIAVMLIAVAGCASQEAARKGPAPGAHQVNSVYIWDADGHTDLTLLRDLKAEAAIFMKTMGKAVSDDPEATDAFIKITVLDASKDEDSGRTSVKARLYILDARDNNVIYDTTYKARGKGDYPARGFVKGALEDFVK